MKAIWTMSMVLFVACNQEEKKHKKECENLKGDIASELQRINHCSSDFDCRVRGVHPHYGCSMTYNKVEDPAAALGLIDEYSNGSCWDGMTTLRLLDCAPFSPGDLKCQAGACADTFDWGATRGKAFVALSESAKNWRDAVATGLTSYTYVVNHDRDGPGDSRAEGSTTIKVGAGKVVKRTYELRSWTAGVQEPTVESYEEEGENLGKNTSGFSAVVIDDIYTQCEKAIFADAQAVDHSEEPEYAYVPTFAADKNGFVAICTRQTRGCLEGFLTDCPGPEGIRLRSIVRE